ncbi:MAG TPA: LacI family DNA-binding transcriptional regulator [Lacunisphaera sp.]|nr:LacI family DNA-binding transcriptional regulator [Lacunisphaera sp.]
MRPVTMQVIADQVGFSKNTVSLALRGDSSISAATRELIRKTADKLGYQPNAVVSHLIAQLRAGRTARFQAKLALINAHRDPKAFRTHATIPAYVAGCERRGLQLGYTFDPFWLHDPKLKAASLSRILRTRGIKGIIIVGLMDHNQLPAHLEAVWSEFPCVVTGVRTRAPALSFSCVDHHDLVIQAFERALTLGYQRPALVVEERIDRLVEGRFSGAMLTAQRSLPAARRVPAFMEVQQSRAEGKPFQQWFDRHKPDVLLSLYNIVFPWLKAHGRRVPQDVGVIQLEWRASHPEIAGMNQHNDAVGEAAVDMVVGQIHRNESGIPAFPRATLIGTSWVDGSSVRKITVGRGR